VKNTAYVPTILLALFTLALASPAVRAAELSTATILAEIEKGSRDHLARIHTARGVARMELTRIYPPMTRPRLPGGAVVLEENAPGGGARARSPRAARTPRSARNRSAAAPRPGILRSTTTLTRSETIRFAFKEGRLRWDDEDIVIKRNGRVTRGATVRRALIGDRLLEYRPETNRLIERKFRSAGFQRLGRREDVPFDPFYYGIKFFGQPLDNLIRQTADRTSVTIETLEGRKYYVLTIAPVGRETRYRRLWIAPKRAYTIARYEAVDPKGFASITLRCTFSPRKNNIWVPASVSHETFDPATHKLLTSRRIVFDEFVPNARVKDEVFTPKGLGADEKTRFIGPRGRAPERSTNTWRRRF